MTSQPACVSLKASSGQCHGCREARSPPMISRCGLSGVKDKTASIRNRSVTLRPLSNTNLSTIQKTTTLLICNVSLMNV